MDGFLSVDSGGAEILARTLQPLVVKNIDNNFIQTVAFLGSMSKTAEVNTGGMQRLAGRLAHVQPETRQQLSAVVASVAQRAAANAAARKDGVTPARGQPPAGRIAAAVGHGRRYGRPNRATDQWSRRLVLREMGKEYYIAG